MHERCGADEFMQLFVVELSWRKNHHSVHCPVAPFGAHEGLVVACGVAWMARVLLELNNALSALRADRALARIAGKDVLCSHGYTLKSIEWKDEGPWVRCSNLHTRSLACTGVPDSHEGSCTHPLN